ncbi:MAG: hypothetical protein ACK50F_02000 [Betaproteobacteria bacterium]|jgi:hypothetical protein|nr:hypothetical protein [Rubrivivax sp.]
MFLKLAGGLLAALGWLSGLVLVAGEVGLGGLHAPGLTLWLLFPLFSTVGYVLLGMGAGTGAADGVGMTRLLAAGLLLLSLAAALALFARAAGMVPASGGAGVLWYVLVLGGLAGAVGTAAAGRRVAAGP